MAAAFLARGNAVRPVGQWRPFPGRSPLGLPPGHRRNSMGGLPRGVRISRVAPDSPAERAGLLRNDRVTRIDGHAVEDFLDFYVASFGSPHTLEVQRRGTCLDAVLKRGRAVDVGLEIDREGLRACANKCIFCFVDQLPRGLRSTLYFKDEDYRLSFLHGNYLTLTNLRPHDVRRIIAMHLSPLYVSVHATDEKVRAGLLGSRRPARILGLLKRLGRGGIRFHTQVVVVPGYNNGKVLERTLRDLGALHRFVQSVSVVPVGLTGHRSGLPPITQVSRESAARIVRLVAGINRREHRRRGRGMVYAADELIIKSGSKIPPVSYYDDFPQIENGVGLARRLLDDIGTLRVPADLKGLRLRLVTGTLAGPLIEELAGKLRERGVRAEAVAVENTLLGASVTVSGLLPGRAVKRALGRPARCDAAVLPPDMFNADGVTLDGVTMSQIEAALGVPVVAGDHDINSMLRAVSKRLRARRA